MYSLVWAVVIVTKQVQGGEVGFEELGWLVAGVVVLRTTFKSRPSDGPPEGGGQA